MIGRYAVIVDDERSLILGCSIRFTPFLPDGFRRWGTGRIDPLRDQTEQHIAR